MRVLAKKASVAIAVTLLGGCATHGQRAAAPSARTLGTASSAVSTSESLSDYIRKVRHLSAVAKPPDPSGTAETLEVHDVALAAALQQVLSAPTAAHHRAVAERYRELGVLDRAYQHFGAAVALDARDADAYEGLARVWRDWGLPRLALGDAQRATFYAPHSASARNTYGTVMQALGRDADARAAYELASSLDPGAAYPVSNLCYLAFVNGRIDDAIQRCTAALRLDPSFTAARNNLALAFAAAGHMDTARAEFLGAGDHASGLYNSGIAYLAAGDDRNALAAFDAASRARPTLSISRERAALIRAALSRANVAARRAGNFEE